ncbi:MAG TPA: hypothetical protein VGG03_12460 [Thermoanaerobaculia bacterium]|jgi:hypothetical protein
MGKAAACLGGAFAALCLAAPIWAGPAAQTAPFPVSGCTNCRQERPAVAGSASGFLVVWEGSSAADLKGISGRLFSNLGTPQAADFLVNKEVAPDQYDAAVTRDLQGNFIVVWSAVANGNSKIMAQKFQANGAPAGNAFKVNQDPAGTPTIPADFNPAVARTNDGGFVVAWISLLPTSDPSQGPRPQVLARRFNANGTPLRAQVKVSTGLVNGDRPDVCVDTAGRPLVVWASVDEFRPFEANKSGVSLRRLSARGVPEGTKEAVVTAPTAGSTVKAAVSCGLGNTFVVVWHSDQAPAVDQTDVLGQRFNRTGSKLGPVFRVNATTSGFQKSPAISHDAQGNFVVVWQADLGTREGIFGRRFNAGGAATGLDFEVLSGPKTAAAPANPDVAHLGTAGNFVVVWQAGDQAVFGRLFTP